MNKTASAIYYDPSAGVPVILATARGILVEKMLMIAESNNIPVYRNQFLARALAGEEVGSSIPEALFAAVAEVYAYCMRVDARVRGKIEGRIGVKGDL